MFKIRDDIKAARDAEFFARLRVAANGQAIALGDGGTAG